LYERMKVHIKGRPPGLLMNQLTPEKLSKKKTGPKKKEYDVDKDARSAAYIAEIDGKEQLYIEAIALYSMILGTAMRYKEQGKRSSISYLLAGTMRVEPHMIPLGHCDWEIALHIVRVPPKTGARVVRARALVPEWEAFPEIILNKNVLPSDISETINTILIDGGTRTGLLDWRPSKKGPYGTFEVPGYEILE